MEYYFDTKTTLKIFRSLKIPENNIDLLEERKLSKFDVFPFYLCKIDKVNKSYRFLLIKKYKKTPFIIVKDVISQRLDFEYLVITKDIIEKLILEGFEWIHHKKFISYINYMECFNEEVDEIRCLYKSFADNLNSSENILNRKITYAKSESILIGALYGFVRQRNKYNDEYKIFKEIEKILDSDNIINPEKSKTYFNKVNGVALILWKIYLESIKTEITKTLIIKELKCNLRDFYYEYSTKLNINKIHQLYSADEECDVLEIIEL
ncbi:hypothetical protein MJU95_016450 [Clostridioides difficile]|nr:hypothetical protein [Clostridioides difficile]